MKKVNIKGTIVSNDNKFIYDFFGIESVCPKDVSAALAEADGEDVTVEINSGGGEVFAGSELYYMLASYAGNVTIDVVGFAGSAASVVAMAGRCRMVPSGLMMIHNVAGGAIGDYRDMDHASSMLKTCNKAIAQAYRMKTKMSESDLLSLMNKETWLHADDARQRGFVDEIIGETEQEPASRTLYNARFATVLNAETIEKARNFLKMSAPEPPKDTGAEEISKYKNQFEII